MTIHNWIEATKSDGTSETISREEFVNREHEFDSHHDVPKPTEMNLTIAQVLSLYTKWQDTMPSGLPFRNFLLSVQPTFGCDGAVTVPWCNMWLLIERDGYTHS